MPKPIYNERIQFSPNCHGRDPKRIRLGAGHTQQARGNAATLANYLNNPASKVSYHNTIDNDRNVVAVVDTDEASWSVGNANDVTLNYCYAGSFAEWSRQEWLDNMGNAIEIHAYLWVLDAKKYGLDPYPISWDDIRQRKSGATDHRGVNEAYLGAKGHWDTGPNYPWDVFHGHVHRFVTEGTDDVVIVDVTAIEYERLANEWLGNRLTEERELVTPPPHDRGRYAHYVDGSIYWTEATGAHAMRLGIRDEYQARGWESGELGFPTGLCLELIEHHRSSGVPVPGGLVQAFEGGTLYVQDGVQGSCVVKGTIRELYRATNYENGDLGWPTSDEQDWAEPIWSKGAVVDIATVGKVQHFEHGRIFWRAASNTALAVSREGLPIFPIADSGRGAAPAPGYTPTAQEIAATPADGMDGGVSHFANPDDASTRGRKMGLSGEPADAPTDQWYAAMRFAYCAVQVDPANPDWVKPVPGTSDLGLKAYLPARRLLVTNPATGAQVVVR
ncbi:MAG: N-acetylmuramoyl-L-alanine amidase, partial [Rhodococcus sp. (in: high G+C Gram-positive bacteria)]